jgi:hypothetical protein
VENRHLEIVINLLESGTLEDIEKAKKIIKAQGTSFKELMGLVDVPVDQSKLPAKKEDLRAYSCAIHQKDKEMVKDREANEDLLNKVRQRFEDKLRWQQKRATAKRQREELEQILGRQMKDEGRRGILSSFLKQLQTYGKPLSPKQKEIFDYAKCDELGKRPKNKIKKRLFQRAKQRKQEVKRIVSRPVLLRKNSNQESKG